MAVPSPTATYHIDTYPAISYTRPELSAKGKSVLITGGGSGIGAEAARGFAAAGASKIALLGRRKDKLDENKQHIVDKYPGVSVFTASVDVTNKAQVDAAFLDFLGGGKIDVVISGAAIMGPLGSIRSVEGAAFVDAVNISLTGALYTAQAFIRHAAPDAVAINISSTSLHLNFIDAIAAYSVAKIAAFRVWDAVSANNPDVRVYHVQPGTIDTDMTKAIGGVESLGREDQAALPAGFFLWLASPEGRFLKGKFLEANWDVEELKARAGEIEGKPLLNIGLVGWPTF